MRNNFFSKRGGTAGHHRPWRLRIYLLLYGSQLAQAMQRDGFDNWSLVQRVLATADAVYLGATGYSGHITIEAQLFGNMLLTKEAETTFSAWLDDGTPMLRGYCLEGLYRLGSKKLLALSPAVLHCEAAITTRLGCYALETTISDLAADLQARIARSELH